MNSVSCIGMYLHYRLKSELNRAPSNTPLFIVVSTGEVVDILFFGMKKRSIFHFSDRRSRRYFVFRTLEVVDILFLGLKKPFIFYFGDRRNRRYFVSWTEEAVDIFFRTEKAARNSFFGHFKSSGFQLLTAFLKNTFPSSFCRTYIYFLS
jgi:hypothetical protein